MLGCRRDSNSWVQQRNLLGTR